MIREAVILPVLTKKHHVMIVCCNICMRICMQTSILVLVEMTAVIKALKHAAETKHEPIACILIRTLAVLHMYQDNYNNSQNKLCLHYMFFNMHL